MTIVVVVLGTPSILLFGPNCRHADQLTTSFDPSRCRYVPLKSQLSRAAAAMFRSAQASLARAATATLRSALEPAQFTIHES